MQTATITRSRPFFWTYPLAPLLASLRCRLRLCLQRRGNDERFCDGMDEGFLIALCPIGTYPMAPLLVSLVVSYACACEEGGNEDRFCEG